MENILTLKEVEREIMAAEMAQRPADFSNKIIQEINLSEMEIKIPLSFERAKILGRVYCNKTIFHQDINFNSAILNRIFYSGESIIKGNFNCQGIKVSEGMNLVGATIEKNINLEGGQIKGFLGLNKIKILGEANFKRIIVQNLEEVTGTIEGDVHFQKAKVKNLDLEGAIIEGTLDFQGITIFGFLNLTNAEIKGILLLKGGIITGEVKSEGLRYKEKII